MRSAIDEAEAAPSLILVVEDEPLIRICIADAFRELGHSVVEAATADEAWAHLAVSGPVDLVLTDHNMPGKLTGADLAQKIAEVWPTVPVVITSGDFDASRHSGRVVRKPYDVFALAAELTRLFLPKEREAS